MGEAKAIKGQIYQFASHAGPLCMALTVTKGPVLELGMGLASTPILHAMCYPSRELLSIDEDFKWVSNLRFMEGGYHHMRHVQDWDSLFKAIGKKWSVVLIDVEAPKDVKGDNWAFERRIRLVKELKDEVGILVVHDTNMDSFHEDPSLWDFKHIWTFKPEGLPWTTLASNKIDFLFLSGIKKKEC